jgi:hypothetical protein
MVCKKLQTFQSIIMDSLNSRTDASRQQENHGTQQNGAWRNAPGHYPGSRGGHVQRYKRKKNGSDEQRNISRLLVSKQRFEQEKKGIYIRSPS